MAEGFFWGSDPNVNQQLRQRIALQMMSNKKGYPKTIGEGLTAIGDSIGDIGIMRRLEAADLAAQGVTPPPLAAAAPTAATPGYAPPDGGGGDVPAVEAINNAISPGAAPPASAAPALPTTLQPAAPAETVQPSAGAPPVNIYNQGDYNEMDAAGDATRRGAIAGIESGGSKNPYALTGAPTSTGDRALGKYQVMGANVPQWTKDATGTALTPDQFLADPQAQEATFHNRFGNYVNKYGEEGAARAWFGGERGMNNPAATDVHGRLNVGGYGQDYLNRRDAIAATLAQQQQQPQPQPDQRLALTAPQGTPTVATDIRPAPPVPSRIAQAQPQQPPGPGYITTPPGDPSGAPTIKMTPRELELRNWLATKQGNPYAAMKVAPELQTLEAERTTRQNEANEKFKAAITRQTEMLKLSEEQKATSAKREQDYRKAGQDIITPAAPGGAAPANDPRLLGTPQSPQRSGIPNAPPVPPGVSPQEWSKLQAPTLAKAVDAVDKAVPAFNEAIKVVRLAREHPGREYGIGATSGIMSNIPGTEAFGFKQINNQIQGKNFLAGYDQLRGGGSITEVEGAKAQEARSRLNTAQNKTDYDKALNDLEISMRTDLETAQRKANQPVTAWRKEGDNASYAPDIGQRRQKEDGSYEEYVGGYPKASLSWRPVR